MMPPSRCLLPVNNIMIPRQFNYGHGRNQSILACQWWWRSRNRFVSSSTATSLLLPTRSDYKHFEQRQTRFSDMDALGHVNHARYFEYMNDSINLHLIRQLGWKYPRVVAENSMTYIRPVKFPDSVDVGLRVVRLSEKSVTYDVGLFVVAEDVVDETMEHGRPNGDCVDSLAARGKFVHVYVNEQGRPIPMEEAVRTALSELVADETTEVE